MEPLHRDASYNPSYHEEVFSQPSLEPNDALKLRDQELYDHIHSLGSKFFDTNKFFEYVHNPYEDINDGNLAYDMLCMTAWLKELYAKREMWNYDPHAYHLASQLIDIIEEIEQATLKYQQKEMVCQAFLQ